MEFFKQILHYDNKEQMEKEVVHRALVNILNKIRKLDYELEDIVNKNKSNLEEFLNHFYEIQKMPEMVVGMDQKEYKRFLHKLYIMKFEQIRKMGYSSSDGRSDIFHAKNNSSHGSVLEIGSKK